MKVNHVPKEFMAILRPYLESGVITLEQGSKHAQIRHRDGHRRPIPGSPSDHRAILNFKCQVRRFVEGVPDSKHLVRTAATKSK